MNLLLEALRANRVAAEACAAIMHETPHGMMVKYQVGGKRFAELFPSWADFEAQLGAGDQRAVEAALEIVSRIDASRVLPIVRELLHTRPWLELGARIGAALARVPAREAVELALEHAAIPYVGNGVAHSIAPDAADAVLARWERSPAADFTQQGYDRRETMFVDGLFRYLGRNKIERARPILERCFVTHPDHHVRLGAGHALMAFEAYDFLIASTWPLFAVKAALAKDAERAVELLGGLEALSSEVANELLTFAVRQKPPPPALIPVAQRFATDAKQKSLACDVLMLAGVPRPKPAKVKAPTPAAVAKVRARVIAARAAFEKVGTLPPRNDPKTVDAIEKAIGGPLPVSLRIALIELGGCSLDAFMLVDPKTALDEALDEGGDGQEFPLAIAPDAVGRAGFSGGREEMVVPNSALDAKVLGVEGEPMFLDYLDAAAKRASPATMRS